MHRGGFHVILLLAAVAGAAGCGGGDGTGDDPEAKRDTWTLTSVAGAPTGRWGHTAVWTGSRMIVWGGTSMNRDTGAKITVGDGGVYDPFGDRWISTSSVNAPPARELHTAVWTGSEMIVWGGAGAEWYGSGAAYNPSTDTWTPIATKNAPNGRHSHTAVWTGSRMIIWGGVGGRYLNTGAVYDRASDTWSPMSTVNAPYGRFGHTAVWTGSRMVVWGGLVEAPGWIEEAERSGGAYDPVTDTWTPISSVSSPYGTSGHSALWAGSRMIVWGGGSHRARGLVNLGASYDPATDTWTPTGTAKAPSPRGRHSAVWTGASMIMWGGSEPIPDSGGTQTTLDGSIYTPDTGTWTPTSPPPDISAESHSAVWTGSGMIVWGGFSGNTGTNAGATYRP